ncbi:MAG: hypothetical protein ACK5JU_13110 [Bacteroidales bacterium]
MAEFTSRKSIPTTIVVKIEDLTTIYTHIRHSSGKENYKNQANTIITGGESFHIGIKDSFRYFSVNRLVD